MDDWRLLYGGAWAQVREALRLSRKDGRPRIAAVIAAGLVPWIVTLILAYLGGRSGAVRMVLEDLGVSVRLLLAVPILLIDEYRVDNRISLILPAVTAGG